MQAGLSKSAPPAPEPRQLRFFTNPPPPPPLSPAAARQAQSPAQRGRQSIPFVPSGPKDTRPRDRPEPHVEYTNRLKAATTLASPTEQLIWMASACSESMAATKLRMTRAMLGMPESDEKAVSLRVASSGSRKTMRGPPDNWARGGELFATARFKDPLPAAVVNRRGVSILQMTDSDGGLGIATGSSSNSSRQKRPSDRGASKNKGTLPESSPARPSPGPAGSSSNRERRRRSGRGSGSQSRLSSRGQTPYRRSGAAAHAGVGVESSDHNDGDEDVDMTDATGDD